LALVAGGLPPSLEVGRLHGASVFTCAILFGAARPLANTLQIAATLFAAACVYASYRRPMAQHLRAATLAAATILGAPHVAGYDAMLVAFAAALLFGDGLEQGFRPSELIISGIAWASPLINPPMYHPIGRLMPIFIALLVAAIMERGRSAFVSDRLKPNSVAPLAQ